MAKIYSSPKKIKEPEFDFANFNAVLHQEAEDKYIEELKQYLQGLGYKEEYTGEIIQFPAADSHAFYMVISMKPMSLMHVPIGDAWTSEYAELMTAKKVKEKIEGARRFAKMWEENKEKQEKKKKES